VACTRENSAQVHCTKGATDIRKAGKSCAWVRPDIGICVVCYGRQVCTFRDTHSNISTHTHHDMVRKHSLKHYYMLDPQHQGLLTQQPPDDSKFVPCLALAIPKWRLNAQHTTRRTALTLMRTTTIMMMPAGPESTVTCLLSAASSSMVLWQPGGFCL
jgi:hypothetical protein